MELEKGLRQVYLNGRLPALSTEIFDVGREVYSASLKAFVLVNMKAAKIDEVMRSLRATEGCKVFEVMGLYDAIVEAIGESKDGLQGVVDNIRSIRGIESTITLFTSN